MKNKQLKLDEIFTIIDGHLSKERSNNSNHESHLHLTSNLADKIKTALYHNSINDQSDQFELSDVVGITRTQSFMMLSDYNRSTHQEYSDSDIDQANEFSQKLILSFYETYSR